MPNSPDLTFAQQIPIPSPVGNVPFQNNFIADSFSDDTVTEILQNGTVGQSASIGTTNIHGLHFMCSIPGTNEILISAHLSNTVVRFNLDTFTVAQVYPLSGPVGPTGILAMNAVNAYVSLFNANEIISLNLVSGATTIVVSSITNPEGLFPLDGLIYVSVLGNDVVQIWDPTLPTWTLVNPNFISIPQPTGLTFFSSNWFVSSNGLAQVNQYNQDGILVGPFVVGLLYPHQPNFNTDLVQPGLFVVSSYGQNEFDMFTFSAITCFHENTQILCYKNGKEDQYIPIHRLRKGDLVKSYLSGYRKIASIGSSRFFNNPQRILECMYKMKKTSSNGLTEDLMLTGGHGMMMDHLTAQQRLDQSDYWEDTPYIEDKEMLMVGLNDAFEKIETNEIFTIYHMMLENDGKKERAFAIYANGILVETPNQHQFEKMKLNLLDYADV